MSGFIHFIRKQGVVGLAVGFILGGAISKMVAALVTDVINPLISLFIGGGKLSDATVMVGKVTLRWGDFVAAIIDFIIIAAVVYFGVKGLGLEKLDQKDPPPQPAPPPPAPPLY